jgi:putative transposase
MLRIFELRWKPKAAQRSELEHILADSVETYHAACEERRDAWKLCPKRIIDYAQQAELTELCEDPRFAKVAVAIQREPLRRVERSLQAFFRRVKAGEKTGYPRFRSRDRYDAFAWHRPRLSAEGWLVPSLGHIRFQARDILEAKSKWRR